MLQDPAELQLLKSFPTRSALLLAQFALEREEIPYQLRNAESFRFLGTGKVFSDRDEDLQLELWVRNSDLASALAVIQREDKGSSDSEICPACGAANPARKSQCPECGLFLG